MSSILVDIQCYEPSKTRNVADSHLNCFTDDGFEDVKEVFKKDCIFRNFLQSVGPHFGDTAKHCLMAKDISIPYCFLIEDDSVQNLGSGYFTKHKDNIKTW